MRWVFETVLNPSKRSVCGVSVGVQTEEEEEGKRARSNHIFQTGSRKPYSKTHWLLLLRILGRQDASSQTELSTTGLGLLQMQLEEWSA
jgi:hypothetical protein